MPRADRAYRALFITGLIGEPLQDMATNRNIWKTEYQERNLPPWPCPSNCGGILVAVGKPPIVDETHGSATARRERGDDWEHSWKEELHVQRLDCHTCGHIAVLVSITSYEEEVRGTGDQYEVHLRRSLRPVSLTPMPRLVTIPPKCPTNVADVLDEAFALLWRSPSATLARIRAALELIMDDQKIAQKMRVPKKAGTWKLRVLPLHHRIDRFKVKHPELGDYLLAAKWLGNEGAHTESKLEDVLVATDLIDEVLGELYGKRSATLRKQASMINRKKGSV